MQAHRIGERDRQAGAAGEGRRECGRHQPCARDGMQDEGAPPVRFLEQAAHAGHTDAARYALAQRDPGEEGGDLQRHADDQQRQADPQYQDAERHQRHVGSQHEQAGGEQARTAGLPETAQDRIATMRCARLQHAYGEGERGRRPRREAPGAAGQHARLRRHPDPQRQHQGDLPGAQCRGRQRARALQHRQCHSAHGGQQSQHPADDAEGRVHVHHARGRRPAPTGACRQQQQAQCRRRDRREQRQADALAHHACAFAANDGHQRQQHEDRQ